MEIKFRKFRPSRALPVTFSNVLLCCSWEVFLRQALKLQTTSSQQYALRKQHTVVTVNLTNLGPKYKQCICRCRWYVTLAYAVV
jgi:hypothetical protein